MSPKPSFVPRVRLSGRQCLVLVSFSAASLALGLLGCIGTQSEPGTCCGPGGGTGGVTVTAGTGGQPGGTGGGPGGAATGGQGGAQSGQGGAQSGQGGAQSGQGGAKTGQGGQTATDAGTTHNDGSADRSDAPATPSDAAADRNRDGGSSSDAGSPIADAGTTDTGGWTLVWSDEFDTDGAPDPSNWGFESGFVRNMEAQWYQSANATVSGGLLTIQARHEQVLNPNYQAGSSDWKKSTQYAQYTSSSMTTSGKHAFMYGRFEMRAKIPTQAGSWPAFWSLGSGTAWPQSGEVDIMEYYNSKVLANVCVPASASGGDCTWQSKSQTLTQLGSGWANDFHVWAMEWTAQSIDLYLDDALVNHFVVTNATGAGITNPFTTKTFYILVNLAIGGTSGGTPNPSDFPLDYQVDYVRVYQKK